MASYYSNSIHAPSSLSLLAQGAAVGAIPEFPGGADVLCAFAQGAAVDLVSVLLGIFVRCVPAQGARIDGTPVELCI